MKKSTTFTVIKICFAAAIFLFLLNMVGFDNIKFVLVKTEPALLIYSMILFLFSFFLQTLAFWTLLKTFQITFTDCLKITLKSMSYAVFTPGRLGEFSIVYFLSNRGMPVGTASGLYFLFYLMSLGIMLCLTFAGCVRFGLVKVFEVAFLLSLTGLTALMVMYRFHGLRKKINDSLPLLVRGRLAGFIKTQTDLIGNRPLTVIFSSFLLLIRLFTFYAMIKVIFSAIGCDASFIDICIIFSVARIVALIPVSMNGLGIREGVQVYLFERFTEVSAIDVMAVAIWQNLILFILAFIFLIIPIDLSHQKDDSASVQGDSDSVGSLQC